MLLWFPIHDSLWPFLHVTCRSVLYTHDHQSQMPTAWDGVERSQWSLFSLVIIPLCHCSRERLSRCLTVCLGGCKRERAMFGESLKSAFLRSFASRHPRARRALIPLINDIINPRRVVAGHSSSATNSRQSTWLNSPNNKSYRSPERYINTRLARPGIASGYIQYVFTHRCF